MSSISATHHDLKHGCLYQEWKDRHGVGWRSWEFSDKIRQRVGFGNSLAKYDWQKIKEDYIHASNEASRPTLEQLAETYRCSPSYLREKAAQENWKIEAERYLQTVAGKRQEQKSTALAGDLAEWDAKCFNAAKAGLILLSSRLQGQIEDVRKGNDDDEEKAVSYRTLDDMAKALERLQKIGRTALGEKEDLSLTLKIDYAQLTDEQLERIAAGENPRDVIS